MRRRGPDWARLEVKEARPTEKPRRIDDFASDSMKMNEGSSASSQVQVCALILLSTVRSFRLFLFYLSNSKHTNRIAIYRF